MSIMLQVEGLRRREFAYQWCHKTEVDYVCAHCCTVSLDGVTCQHCHSERVKKESNLQKFLDSRKGDES